MADTSGPPPEPRVPSGLAQSLTVLGYKAAGTAVRYLPEPVVTRTATGLGFAASGVSADKRRVVARNLRRVLGPSLRGPALERKVQQSFEWYARYWAESFRLPSISAADVRHGMGVRGFGNVEAALTAGHGAIVALPHLGGWEWAGRWLADEGYKVTVVVEALEPPELFEWFAGFRRSLGMNIVPLGPDAGGLVLKALRDNHIVCLLCDRDLTHDGVPVEFFGERTTLPPGPATLSLRTGAPILPTAVYFEPGRDRHLGWVRDPVDTTRTGRLRDDIALVTQRLAHELEILVRRAPEQWHLFQPNWPSDPGYGL